MYLFVINRRPPNVQMLPILIQAVARAFAKTWFPTNFNNILNTIPKSGENIQHHPGSGVMPFAKALICVAISIIKKIKNIIVAGNRK